MLPILLAVVFYLQQKFTPQPPSDDARAGDAAEDDEVDVVLLFPLFLYNGPSGLNLYILTSTTIGIIESKRIRDHIKQKEEEEKAGKIIVDAGIGKKKKRDDEDKAARRREEEAGPKPPRPAWPGCSSSSRPRPKKSSARRRRNDLVKREDMKHEEAAGSSSSCFMSSCFRVQKPSPPSAAPLPPRRG